MQLWKIAAFSTIFVKVSVGGFNCFCKESFSPTSQNVPAQNAKHDNHKSCRILTENWLVLASGTKTVVQALTKSHFSFFKKPFSSWEKKPSSLKVNEIFFNQMQPVVCSKLTNGSEWDENVYML